MSDAAALIADVIVVAAGSSTRMDGVDKMTAPIRGRPLLAWSVDAFAASPLIERIVIVGPADRLEAWRQADWLTERAVLVEGGSRRQASVAAGVARLEELGAEDDRVILVHDGARPAVREPLVEQIIAATADYGAAIPILPVVETLKRVGGGLVVETVERDGLGAAQTPQGIRLGILRAAYARFRPDGPRAFTDEAALLEACTIPVHVVPGQADNLKVTLPADLDRAAWALGADRARVGYGDDSHPFGPGEPLALGGIELARAPRLSGHSDGDVVLHALADALLGAAGLNDLGRLFPADARTPRGIASTDLLAEVLARVADGGLRPAHVDVTIIGARPRLADRLDSIRARLAELLLIREDQVNVKASTGNLDGMEGAGRGITARVVATLERLR